MSLFFCGFEALYPKPVIPDREKRDCYLCGYGPKETGCLKKLA